MGQELNLGCTLTRGQLHGLDLDMNLILIKLINMEMALNEIKFN